MTLGRRILATAALCVVVVTGCSSSSSGPKLAAADGTVKYEGKPLAGATVTFVPEKGPVAMGITDVLGKFQLSTGTTRGVVVGPVKVSITANDAGAQADQEAVSKRPQTPAETEAYMKKAAEMQAAMARGEAPTQPKSLIPEKYAKSDTSELSFTIKADGKNHFDIEIK